jgi:hypothetical protein
MTLLVSLVNLLASLRFWYFIGDVGIPSLILETRLNLVSIMGKPFLVFLLSSFPNNGLTITIYIVMGLVVSLLSLE